MTNNRSYGKLDQIIAKGKKGDAGLSTFIGEMVELTGWFTRATFDGLTIKRKGDGWMMIVRVRKKGKHLVTFVESHDVLGLYRQLYVRLVYDKGYWKADKYRSGA